MSNLKGGSLIGLAVIAVVAIIGISLLFTAKVLLSEANIKARSSFKINLEADDRGTEAAAFLGAEKNGRTYMELIGATSAENYKDFISDDIASIKSTVDKLNSKIKKAYSFSLIGGEFSHGPEGYKTEQADMPLPGGLRGHLEVKS